MRDLDLAAWLERLETFHPADIELGLDRVSAVAAKLDCLDLPSTVVTVAGTNGKGSTVAALEALALQADRSVATYTSPHLLVYNERVRIDGVAVSDETLVEAFEQVEVARAEIPLTYFEFGTLAALLIFKTAAPDLLVLEVGLGGRLDAVNIIDPDVAVITSISVDHQSWLGGDRETIGREKAGILRENVPVVLADPDPPRSVLEKMEALHCQASFHDADAAEEIPDWPLRRENLHAAWRVAEYLGFAPQPEMARSILGGIELPGRMQRFSLDGLSVLVDVAHNEAAVASMANYLEKQVTGRCIAVFAALSDKDIHAMIRSCREHFDAWYLADLPAVKRALPAKELAARMTGLVSSPMIQCRNPAAALERAIGDCGTGDTLVIFGSFYTVAELLPILQDKRSRA
jgi:dihydrofolate synthase/folylpolyglutamate synthase